MTSFGVYELYKWYVSYGWLSRGGRQGERWLGEGVAGRPRPVADSRPLVSQPRSRSRLISVHAEFVDGMGYADANFEK